MSIMDFIVPLLLYTGLNAGDLLSTEHALGLGAVERNPYGQTYGGRLLVNGTNAVASTGIDVGLGVVQRRYRGRTIGKTAGVMKWAMRIGMGVIMGFRVYENMQVAGRMQRQKNAGT